MSGLPGLGPLLGDPELKSLVSNLVSRKISADLKTLEAHAELVRQLTDSRRRGGEGGVALKRIVREHLEYYAALVEMSHGFHQRLLDMLADAAGPGNGSTSVNATRLALRGSPGETIRAPFALVNGRAEPLSVTCRASPFVSEDGSQLVASDIRFDPPAAEIAPGAETVIHALVTIGPDLLVGRSYFASVGALEVDEVKVVVFLTVDEAPAPAAPGAPRAPGASKRARKRPDPKGSPPTGGPAR